MNLDYKKIIEDFRITYRTFEQYESRVWGAEGNMIELYKQVGELVACYNNQSPQLADEVLDVIAQMIRLCDFYEFDIEAIFEASIKICDNSNETAVAQTIFSIVEHVGILSKYIMMEEKYYFRSRVDEPSYMISNEKFIECISNIISLALSIAKEKNIDLNETNINTRKIDQEWFPKIEEQEKIYLLKLEQKKTPKSVY